MSDVSWNGDIQGLLLYLDTAANWNNPKPDADLAIITVLRGREIIVALHELRNLRAENAELRQRLAYHEEPQERG